MANKKITELAASAGIAATDKFVMVDVSDTSMASTGTNVKPTASEVAAAMIVLGSLYASGGTDVAIADGGTGSSTAAGARTNLSVPKVSSTTPVEGDSLLWDSANSQYSPRKLTTGLNVAFGLPPLTSRALHPYAASTSTALSGGQVQTRVRHLTLQDILGMRLVFVNAASSGGLTGLGTFTLQCAVERPGPSTWSVTFNGASSVVMTPGSIVVSDPIGVAVSGPANGNPAWYGTATPYFWTRTLLTFDSSGGKWPRIEGINTGLGDGCEIGLSGGLTPKLTSGTIGTSDDEPFGPCAIVGRSSSRLPIVAGIGDSIMIGSGDTPTAGTPGGYTMRALYTAKIPSVRHGVSGERIRFLSRYDYTSGFGSGINWMLPFLDGCTHSICEYGINDFVVDNITVANLQIEYLRAWDMLAGWGTKVYQTTLLPVTTSSDSWATTGNQTVTAYNTKRTEINDWIRDGAPCVSVSDLTAVATGTATAGTIRAGTVGHPLTGYFDAADYGESSRNSGIWKANYTSDGIHPNATGAAAIAAAIDTSVFTV